MAAKLMQNIKASKFLKELKEFDNLIKAIGECKSKSEEDRIIVQELEVLKQRFNDPKLDKSRGREYMVRLIYCEMLGHDASFAYIKALQFASEPNIFTKKAAYLALTQLLDHNNELVLLLVNTLLSDLKSDNYIIVCSALTVTARLIGLDLISAVYPTVVERLRHPKEHVRKKAVMALHRFNQLDPRHEGPLSGIDLDKHFRTTLCDKDPSVMSASLCALYEAMRTDTRPYKNLIPSFTSILKQVSEHRLPKSYDYHRFPAPFIQIKLLKILAVLGAGDKASSENMYAVVHQTLRRANSSHTIGNALIFECVRTISTIYPNPALLAAAAESIAGFLKSPSHNLRYVGIDALSGVVKINPAYAQEHQVAVIDCLEDPDDTLKLKTLELLYKMTKSNNVEVIVERMMTYLRTAVDEHVKKEIVRKVSGLAERYAPDPTWFMTVMSEVFELGGEHVDAQLAHNLCRLIAEQEEDLHRSAVATYLTLLEKPKQPEILLQVIVWVLGEYGYLAMQPASGGAQVSAESLVERLVGVLDKQRPSDALRAAVLTALTKLCSHTGVTTLSPEAERFVSKAASSQSLELQQRSYELTAILASAPALRATALPRDASREEFDEAEMAQIRDGASFLDGYVQRALAEGAAPYMPEELRVNGAAQAVENGAKGGLLRFEAYEMAPAPTPMSKAEALLHAAGAVAHSGSSGTSSLATSSRGGAAASASGDPQLSLRGPAGAAKSAGKWGPAEFAAAEQPPRGGAAAAASSSGRATQIVGDLLGGGAPPAAKAAQAAAAAARPAAAAAAPVRPPSERDRLAASIFGGASAAGSGSKARTTPQLAPPPPGGPRGSSSSNGASLAVAVPRPPPQPQPDLLGGFSPVSSPPSAVQSAARPAAAAPVAPPVPRNDMDLLMDFADAMPTTSAPPAAAHHQQQQQQPTGGAAGAYGLDVLGWGAGPSVSAPQPQGRAAGGGGGGGSAAQLMDFGMPSTSGAQLPLGGWGGGAPTGGGALPLLGGGMMHFNGAAPQGGMGGLMGFPAPPPPPPLAFGAYSVPVPQLGAAAAGRPRAAGTAMLKQPGAPAASTQNDPFGDLI